MTSVAAIAVAARRRKILSAFRAAGATSVVAAKPPESLKVSRGLLFRRLLKSGVLKEEPGGNVWLDEAAQAHWERNARRLMVTMFVLALVVACVLMLIR